MKPITLLCFGALAMFSNVASAAMCKDFDDDMNIIEYECGTSLQKALEQQKQKKIEEEYARQHSTDEDELFAEFNKKTETKKSKRNEDLFFGQSKQYKLQKYIGGNLIYAPSTKAKDYEISEKLGHAAGFSVAAGLKHGNIRGDIEFKSMSGMKFEEAEHYKGGEYTSYYCNSYYYNGQCIGGTMVPQYTTWYETDSNLTVKFKTVNLMLNGYYDFDSFGAITPFVSGGFGLIRTTVELEEINQEYQYDDYYNGSINYYPTGTYHYQETRTYSSYAYHIGAGIAFALNDSLTIDFAYRYNGTGKFEDIKLFSHELLLGGRIMF